MAVNAGDQSKRIYVGTGDRGLALVQTFESLAQKHTSGSVSKLLVDAAIEKYKIDPSTGKISNRSRTTKR